MDQIGLLLVLAQIGVGVAGFASLATVLGQAWASALSRIFLEQWITFPRVVLTGAWWRSWRPTG